MNLINDLQISQEMFLQACSIGLNDPANNSYFEQLVSAENFNYFKCMMVRRNVKLQEEAYIMLFNNLESSGFGFNKEQMERAIEASKKCGTENFNINEFMKSNKITRR